ncbi:hypothetical protein QJS83_16980 [Bdellovibrio sp. 22V]|uniref:hypothetical protein n=1 Tax=Bdellovibrio sp. 22V TaxID=3044166 RepID=UPI002543912E|nr:hypothetical protein [Bdellovibrio sp. 22V]WII72159.1 hypothetical protein QJS83_16980 [Bdellovibrio sp. 22V]
MSNFKSKTVEKKETNLLDIITAGATVKAALDVNDIKSEMSELKKIEQERSWAEDRERREARRHREKMQEAQHQHQQMVKEEMERRARYEQKERQKNQKERAVIEIEEIQSLGLGIRHHHYDEVKDITIRENISRQLAAKAFRENVIQLGYGLLLPEDFCPAEQTFERICERYPEFPDDKDFLLEYFEECFIRGLSISESYSEYTSKKHAELQRQKVLQERMELDENMIAERAQLFPKVLNDIDEKLQHFQKIESDLSNFIKNRESSLLKRSDNILMAAFLVPLLSVGFLFLNEGWKAAIVYGLVCAALSVWFWYSLLIKSKLVAGYFYEKAWFKDVNSKLIFKNLNEPHWGAKDLKMIAPAGYYSSTEAYDSDLKKMLTALRSATDSGFVFAIKYLLPQSPYDEKSPHHVIINNAHLFSKERALYLLSMSNGPHASLTCAQEFGIEAGFLHLLKRDHPRITEVFGSPEDADEEDDVFYRLKEIYDQVTEEYSVVLADELFWIYGHHTYTKDMEEKPQK